jgi:hypothetical protein
MRLLTVTLASLAVAGLAHADVKKDGKDYVLTTTNCPWELRFPRGKWKIGIKQLEGGQSYVLFNDDKSQLTVSFYIEPASQCETSVDCRELYWKNPGPMVQNPAGVAQFERAGFAIVRYELAIIPNAPFRQLNYSAHLVRDGYWVDMHISKLLMSESDEKPLEQFIDAITIQQRSP